MKFIRIQKYLLNAQHVTSIEFEPCGAKNNVRIGMINDRWFEFNVETWNKAVRTWHPELQWFDK